MFHWKFLHFTVHYYSTNVKLSIIAEEEEKKKKSAVENH